VCNFGSLAGACKCIYEQELAVPMAAVNKLCARVHVRMYTGMAFFGLFCVSIGCIRAVVSTFLAVKQYKKY
jgi:hypothetical protein